MGAWHYLSKIETESNSKLVLLYLIHLVKDKETFPDGLTIGVEDISSELGLSKQQVWRSQSRLKKAGVLNIKPTYSRETGKKEYDTYEIIFELKTVEEN